MTRLERLVPAGGLVGLLVLGSAPGPALIAVPLILPLEALAAVIRGMTLLPVAARADTSVLPGSHHDHRLIAF
jgi:hypothetical protein